MKTIKVNDNEVNFLIDYVRVPRKANHNYSNIEFDYNCDLSIVTKRELTDYEREIVERCIKNIVNRIDKETREILKVDYEWSFLENKYYKNSTYKIDDLIKADLVEKVEEVIR